MTSSRTDRHPWSRALAGLALCATTPCAALAEAPEVTCTVLYRTADGIFVDAGRDRGVREGDLGTVERDGVDTARVEVVRITRSTSLLRVFLLAQATPVRTGDSVRLVVSGEVARTAEDGSSPPASSPSDDDEFVPLLAPPEARSVGLTSPLDTLHGTVWLRQLLQFEDDDLRDYSITRLGSSGSWERIGRTPWSFEWSLELAYRDGKALEDTPDHGEPRLYASRLALVRPFEKGGLIRLGRFLPVELPGLGYLDGLQVETLLAGRWRLGCFAGLAPTRERLDVSVTAPGVTPYLTVDFGDPSTMLYSATVGLHGALWNGSPDRLALMVHQSATIASNLRIHSSQEVDFDVGAFESRSGVRLTRFDTFAIWSVTDWLDLRAGVDHWERLDNEAQRDLVGADPRLFDDGFWRYRVGASQRLPFALRLSEEVFVLDSELDDGDPRWSLQLTRTGLPWLPAATVSVSVYNLEGFGFDGYGGRVTASVPLWQHRLYVWSALGFRLLESSVDDDDTQIDLTDVSLRLEWRITEGWSIYGGAAHSIGTDVERYAVDLGLQYRW